MDSLNHDNQADLIEAFNSTSKYLDDLLNIDNPYFEGMVNQMISKLYRQIVGIPMGTNCAPLIADLFLFCYENDFMDSLNHGNQADVIEAFNWTSIYLGDLFNMDNPYFEGMVNLIYSPEQQLHKANTTDTKAPF